MSDQINIDYIGTVSLTDTGLLEYRRLPITKLFDEEMQTLKAMCDNENRNRMDLQDYFQRFMPQNSSIQKYDYCAPNCYTSSFISGAMYPKIYSYDEYQTELKNVENLETIDFLSKHNAKHISELTFEQKELLNKSISDTKDKKKKSLKDDFFNLADRFVQAHRFYKELNQVKSDNRNKMYSTENIGWTTFNYTISDDILFFMKSNFGYGNSSYHYINLTYKGIDILPYSAIVKYYYVNMAEFYRYTRQYRPSHSNWEVALDFVVETANLAIQDEKAFITEWIANEIEEMVAGLKIISQQPQECLKDFFDNPKNDMNLLYVRNAYRSDKNEYLAYPEEVSTIFKAEKLSTALELLDKLQALSTAHPLALEAIECIKELNINFFPNLKEYIEKIENEIKERQEILEPKIKECDILKEKGKPHYDKIDELIENAREKGSYNSTEIRDEYLSTHPDFRFLYYDIESRSEEIRKDEYQISMRENFVERLDNCKLLIIEKLKLAA